MRRMQSQRLSQRPGFSREVCAGKHPSVTHTSAAGAAGHEHAQEVAEIFLQKLQEQVRWLALLPALGASLECQARSTLQSCYLLTPGAERRHGAQGGTCSVQGPNCVGTRRIVVQSLCGHDCVCLCAICQQLAPQHVAVGTTAWCSAPARHNLAPPGAQAEAELKACREASDAKEEQRAAELRGAADADARARQVRCTASAAAPSASPWLMFCAARVHTPHAVTLCT